MKKIIKRGVSVFLAVMLLCSCSVCLFAASVSAATMRWTSILSMQVDMAFDGDEGETLGIARKQTTATNIEGTVFLYKYVGDDLVYVDEWYNSKTRGTLTVGGTFPCESGVTYKAIFVVTAYTDGIPETEVIEYNKVCP